MMKSVLVLCIILILVGVICGDVNLEIIDPWVVKFKFYEGREGGGTFVSENYVLSKAIFFLDDNKQLITYDYEVFIYKKNLTNNNVVEIFVHEDYNKKVDYSIAFDLALVKFDLHHSHAIPVKLRKTFDESKINEAILEEKKNLQLIPKEQSSGGSDLCTLTSAEPKLAFSLGAGLVYYDAEEKENVIIGVFASFSFDSKTNGYLQSYYRINDSLVDWIEAHTSDDTLTVENYCSKIPENTEHRTIMAPKINTQGEYFNFEWQVRIYNNITQLNCGGSLIKPDIILTASFCTWDKDSKKNQNSYSLKFKNTPLWQTDIVEKVEYCDECYDNHHRLIPGDSNIAMMFITIQTSLQTITPIRTYNSKSFDVLLRESFAHSALVPTIRNDFEDGQATFTAQRIISDKDCATLYRFLVGRICTKDRQKRTISSHDIGNGLIYCNEQTGESQLYGVLLFTNEYSQSSKYGYLKYYEDWVHF